ncbi:MAG: ATP-binding cassette domain-containing protein [Candidatus Adiutrix sp.]|jgi:iron complex transport system ATP-binding protein|nr:ATP-binding cassette domain-containing protein [Candidatus Adiutrix sp.]
MSRMEGRETVISADRLSFRRGREYLIRDISWRVARGEHWAVLGPNGAGKTILLRLLTGYIWPTEGVVEILGQRLGRVDLRELRRRLGWVAKTLEEMTPARATVGEVILSGPRASLGLYEEPSAGEMRLAREAAEQFGLGRLFGREFGLLSSGEKQRALLARAALAGPELLFLDEPMSNLDLAGRETFLARLGELAAPGGPTIILTTHNTLEIGPFLTHALILAEGGAVLAAGPLAETLTPENLSRAFGLPLRVEKAGGRYLAFLEPN